MITQEQKVLDFLNKSGTITESDARSMNIFHLPVIISRLRKNGVDITTTIKSAQNHRKTVYSLSY